MQFLTGHEIEFDAGATDGLTRIWIDYTDTAHQTVLIKATLEELVELRTELTRAITRQRNQRK